MRLLTLVGGPVVMLAAVALTPAASAAHAGVAPSASPAPAAPPAPPPPPAAGRERDRERDDNRVRRAWLGVVLSGDEGTRIGSVAEGSPAAEAGLKEGDRILEIDGKEIEYGHDVLRVMRSMTPGDRVQVRVKRDGDEKTMAVTLGERPEPFRHEFRYWAPDHDDEGDGVDKEEIIIRGPSRNYLGVEIHPMSEDLRAAMKAPRDRGVLVNKVAGGSPADEAGIRAGDIIIGVGDQTVEDAGDIGRALRDREPGDEVPVKVIRDGSERSFDVKIARRPGPAGRRGGLWTPGFDGLGEVLSEQDREQIRRTIDEAMRQVHEQMKERGEEMRHVQEQLREQTQQIRQQIREQIRQQIQGIKTATRASNVYDI